MPKRIDLTNQRFSRLLVLEHYGFAKNGQLLWRCLCDCGTEKLVASDKLRYEKTKSCGCLQSEVARERLVTHGFCGHPVYTLWCSIKTRCYNPNYIQYKDYGGRGIRMSDEWKDNAEMFCEWALANGWKPGLVIDRKDNDGNYGPDNCRFITRAESNRNTRLLRADNKTGYRGVTYRVGSKKSRAGISIDGKRKNLGQFNTAIEAALVWDEFAKHLNDGRPLNFGEVS